jgi:Fe-S-cluster containining protein
VPKNRKWILKLKTLKNSPNPAVLHSGTTLSECTRCGTCCEKGGPCFHEEDRMLIEKGTIPAKYLYTLRKGELARDNVKDCLKPVESDIIKIKGKKGSWTCLFFDEVRRACTIYDDRPLECRALKCWDTRRLEQIYANTRLTRNDLLSNVKGLWDLIKDHQVRCDYKKLEPLIKDLAGSKKNHARRKLLEIIHYDAEIRNLVVARGGMDTEMLDFLFGRPLNRTLENYGVQIHQEGKKCFLDKG